MRFDPAAFIADRELLDALEQRAAPVPCENDHILFHQGEVPSGVFILVKGEVALTMSTPTGQSVVDMRAGAGSLLGLPGVVGNEPYSMTAVAQPGAELHFVAREKFATIMQTSPALAMKILQVLAAEVRSARRALADR
jgi:CRP/FNR family transcriptional regulator, cyclic AMP receptor protein